MLLNNKTAIVTGAAQGIGARIAMGLAEEGANVTIADVLDGEKVAKRIVDKGGNAIAVITDITDSASVSAMAAATQEAFGGVDILVNNAALFGTLKNRRLEQIDDDEWDRVMSVNVRGVWECVKAVIPSMDKRGGGSIVHISTNRVFKGFPQLLHYDASKGAVLAMTRAMAAELGDRNIRVNTVAPGLTMSETVQAKEGVDERNTLIVSGRAIKRSQEPEDLIGPVLFFASDLSGFVTGQSLIVDGGGIMR